MKLKERVTCVYSQIRSSVYCGLIQERMRKYSQGSIMSNKKTGSCYKFLYTCEYFSLWTTFSIINPLTGPSTLGKCIVFPMGN